MDQQSRGRIRRLRDGAFVRGRVSTRAPSRVIVAPTDGAATASAPFTLAIIGQGLVQDRPRLRGSRRRGVDFLRERRSSPRERGEFLRVRGQVVPRPRVRLELEEACRDERDRVVVVGRELEGVEACLAVREDLSMAVDAVASIERSLEAPARRRLLVRHNGDGDQSAPQEMKHREAPQVQEDSARRHGSTRPTERVEQATPILFHMNRCGKT